MLRVRIGIYAIGILAVFGLAQCVGCSSRQEALSIKGSDTMVLLGQRWAERYMAAHPGAVIQLMGGGSGTGIAALINGTTDICQASRPMKDKERTQIQEKFGGPPYEIVVAKDGLTVYVHESNPLAELTIAQIKGVYSGATTNWNQLGGPDKKISVYGRENSSGTYEYFKEHVLEGGDFAAAVQTLPGTAAVVNAVAQDPFGIGYGGAAYAKGVREVGIKKSDAEPAVMPTADAVRSGAYPLSRDLYFYTRKAPEAGMKEFVEFALSDSGQAVVSEVGYFRAR